MYSLRRISPLCSLLSALLASGSELALSAPPAPNITATGNNPTPVNSEVTNTIQANGEIARRNESYLNTSYPNISKISYNNSNGQLTFNPSWAEGKYNYTWDGTQYPITAKAKTIQLLDPAQLEQNQKNIATNQANIEKNLNTANSQFAVIDKISYSNGTLIFGSNDPLGKTPPKTVQLFDPTSTSQSAGALNQEMLNTRATLSSQQQEIMNVSSKVDKQGKAISVNAAFAALPSGYLPDKNFVGIGVGHFDKHTGVAVGLTRSFDNGIIIQGRYGVSGGTSVVAASAGIGF